MKNYGDFDPRFTLKQRDAFPNYAHSIGVLTKPECDSLISDFANSDQWSWGTVGDGIEFRQDLQYRSAEHINIPFVGYEWLYEKVKADVELANDRIWNFDVHSFAENLQILRYTYREADAIIPSGHYDWHQDYGAGNGSLRKISVVVNLSDPTLYTGCNLTLFTYANFVPTEIQPGTVLTFPTYIPHCVTAITSGTRYALVTWVHGPQFR